MTPSRKRRLLLVLGALAVVAGALLFGLFPQEPVRRLAERRLRDALGPGARIGLLHVVPATLTAQVGDVVLEGPGYRVEIPAARATLSAQTLLGDVVSLDALQIQSPRLVLRPAATPAATATGAPGRPLFVRDFRLTRGSVVYDDPVLGGPLRLEGLDARGGLGDRSLDVAMDGGVWERPKPLRLGPAQARLRVSSLLEVRVESFSATTERSRVAAKGSLGRIGALAPALGFEATLDLAEAAGVAGTAPLAGVLEAKGQVSTRSGGALEAEATLEGRSLGLAEWPVDAARLRLERSGAVTTASLRLDLLGGRVEGEGRLAGSMVEGRLNAASLDLTRLGAPAPGTLSGHVSWRGDVAGALAVRASVTATARAEAAALLVLGEAAGSFRLPDTSLDAVWNAAVQAEGTASAATPRLEAARLVVKGTARGPLPPQVDGVLEGTVGLACPEGPRELALRGAIRGQGRASTVTLEARGLGGTIDAGLESPLRGALRARIRARDLDLHDLVSGGSGRVHVDLDATAPFGRPSGHLRIDGADLAWRGVALGPLHVGLEGRAGRGELSLDAPALALSGQGRLDLAPRRRLAATLTLADTPLGPFAPLLGPETPLGGRVRGTVSVALPLDEPGKADVRAELAAIQVTSGRLSTRTTRPLRARFLEGRVHVEDLALEGSGLTVEASGVAGLGPRDPLDLRVRAEADLARAPAPEAWTLAGAVRTDLHVTGTAARPAGTGSLTLTAIAADLPSAPRITVDEGRIDLDGTALVLPGLRAALADGSVTISGRVPFAALSPAARDGRLLPRERAALEVAWEGLQAGRLLAPFRPADATLPSASLSGHAHLEGGFASLAELRATVAIPRTAVAVQEIGLDVEPFEIVLEGERVRTGGLTVASRAGTLRLEGGADFGRRTLDVSGRGLLELRALSPFLAEASLTGSADLDLAVGGTLDAPRPRGTVRVRDGTLRIRDVPQALTDLQAALTLDETRVVVEEVRAQLGGGALTITGGAGLEKGALADVRLLLAGRNVALRYPEGLRSRLDADLTLTGKPGAFLLSGDVRAQRGLYDLDVAFAESLRAPVTRPLASPVLRGVALDLRVVTEAPVRVRNNVANLQARGQLAFRGDAETPLPYGRLEIEPGGTVTIQDRDFRIESGRLDYDGSWNPIVELVAETARPIPVPPDEQRGEKAYTVRVDASGSLEQPRLQFSAKGLDDEGEIIALLATGHLGGAALAGTGALAGQQAATLLAAGLTRGITSEIRKLGFDEVTIQPELLAREADPGARFTFAKQVTSAVRLLYSLSLNNPENRFVQLEARPGLGASLSVRRQDDGTFDYGVGQRFLRGGPRRPAHDEEEKTKLAAVRFEGEGPLPEAALREELRARPGRKVTEWDLLDDADRVRERLVAAGHLEAEVGSRLVERDAVFSLRPGPHYRWRVEGMTAPPDLGPEMRRALFEEEALDRGTSRLLRELRGRGHLRARIETSGTDVEDGRLLVFTARPGPVLSLSGVTFPGAAVLSRRRLLAAAGGPTALLTAPDAAREGIRAAYRARHFLAAEVDPPRVQEAGDGVSIEVRVREGPRARVAAVRFEGATLPEADLRAATRLSEGVPFLEEDVVAAVERVRDLYYSRGYAAVRVVPALVPSGPDLDVLLRIAEGDRVVVGSVTIQGLSRTRERLVRRRIDLRPGDPLDPRRLGALERDLLALAIFSRVSVTASSDSPAVVTVRAEESPWLEAGYELRYNDQDAASALVDAEASNLLGVGLALGGRYRVGADLREGRASLNVPFLGRGRFTASAFRLEEDFEAVDFFTGEPFTNVRVQRGFQGQQTQPLGGKWNLLLGYRFKRVSTTSFPDPIDVAGVDVSLLRDTRDNVLDMRRGRFWSFNVEYSPKTLGSDFTFVKGLAQAFVARPLTESLTWAQGYRLGLAHGFGGQEVVSSERFTGGGGNSLRGFATGDVGPRDFLDDPTGGEAVLILNQELRYRHRSGLGAVVFYDAGNVFATVSDVGLDLRHTLGAGLRYASPVGLLRVDVGYLLDGKSGEKPRQIHLSIGQAF